MRRAGAVGEDRRQQRGGRHRTLAELLHQQLHGLPADYLNGYVGRIYAVTPAQVQEMAKKYILDDKATIVIVGDRKVIEEQVKEFGPLR